jgi:hypothetical protein
MRGHSLLLLPMMGHMPLFTIHAHPLSARLTHRHGTLLTAIDAAAGMPIAHLPSKGHYLVGVNPCLMACKRRRCFMAFAIVVPLAFVPCGEVTRYFPSTLEMLYGIGSPHRNRAIDDELILIVQLRQAQMYPIMPLGLRQRAPHGQRGITAAQLRPRLLRHRHIARRFPTARRENRLHGIRPIRHPMQGGRLRITPH